MTTFQTRPDASSPEILEPDARWAAWKSKAAIEDAVTQRRVKIAFGVIAISLLFALVTLV